MPGRLRASEVLRVLLGVGPQDFRQERVSGDDRNTLGSLQAQRPDQLCLEVLGITRSCARLPGGSRR